MPCHLIGAASGDGLIIVTIPDRPHERIPEVKPFFFHYVFLFDHHALTISQVFDFRKLFQVIDLIFQRHADRGP
jgi:hypothetical protein